MLIFKFLCLFPILGKPTDEMSGPKKGPGCSSYSECHNSELQSLPGLFGEACITSACNMPDSNQHSSSHEHWWLFKSKRNSINMQANWFSWVPVQICLKNQKLPNSKAIYSIFASFLYHGCVLFYFFFFLLFWSHSCEPYPESTLYDARGTTVERLM